MRAHDSSVATSSVQDASDVARAHLPHQPPGVRAGRGGGLGGGLVEEGQGGVS